MCKTTSDEVNPLVFRGVAFAGHSDVEFYTTYEFDRFMESIPMDVGVEIIVKTLVSPPKPVPEIPKVETSGHPKPGEKWSVNIAKDGHKPIISVLTVTMTDEDGNLYAGYPDGGGSVIVPRENFDKKVKDAAREESCGK